MNIDHILLVFVEAIELTELKQQDNLLSHVIEIFFGHHFIEFITKNGNQSVQSNEVGDEQEN